MWLLAHSVTAQTIGQAATAYNRFAQCKNSGQENAAWPALYESYEIYLQILQGKNDASAEHIKARQALTTIYPFLQEAAFYYAARNDQPNTLKYAQAHVGLSVLPEMAAESLPRNANYTQVAMLAAFNTWNKGEVAKSIPYMRAYISTGDTQQRREAYDCLGKGYYLTKNYTEAQIVLEEGLRLYPGTWSMLVTIINACGENKDDAALQKYVTQALQVKPDDEALLNNQGKLYEKRHEWDKAAGAYERIRVKKPQSLDVARHLAQDYYNAGITLLNEAHQPKVKKSVAKELTTQANGFFAKAEPLLSNILASDPLSVQYAYALATVYDSMGQESQLQSMNQKISALGFQPIDNAQEEQQLALMDINEPTPLPTPKQTPTPTPQPTPTPVADNDYDIPSIDTDIPQAKAVNDRTFAVIIANEDYKKLPAVPMAHGDGQLFAEYCHKALGLPMTNIRTYYNATNLEMEDALDDIEHIAKKCGGDLRVLFYYAGHGMPDEETKEAFLMPIDCSEFNTKGCMPLRTLYDRLADLNAKDGVMAFLDACFSGGKRDGGTISKVRGVLRRERKEAVKGNLVVLSATTSGQSAMAYEKARHGMFTYYLLLKLKETKGQATLGDLADYVMRQVSLQSQLINRKSQDPTVEAGTDIGDQWRKLRLNK